MAPYRLPEGGRIDRSKTLSFRFDGRPVAGHPGDTVASALLGAGVSLMGRSFKYHRPRGVVTANSAEPNALVTVGTDGRREPNCRATVVDLTDGLVVESQNRWPSLGLDVGALNGLLSPFLAAGFYYKTFMAPGRAWEKLYEPFVRRAAGLGRAGYEPDPDAREKRWAHCDLLVVGGGPAGLAAALTAGRAGARVILADEDRLLGGSLLQESASVGGASADAFLAAMLAELESLPTVRLMTRTTVFGWYDDMVFGAVERVTPAGALPAPGVPVERLWRIAARRALLATGAEERPVVFAGNDRPGVTTATAALAYARRFGVAMGRRVAVFGNGPGAIRTADALTAAGVGVTAVIGTGLGGIDGRPFRALEGGLVQAARGGRALKDITVVSGGRTETIDVDALAVSGGFSPRIHLACQRGARPVWNDALGAFLAPAGTLPTAGSAAGATTLAACLEGGAAAAGECLGAIGIAAPPAEFGPVEGDHDAAPAPAIARVKGGKGKAFVDFQNDVKDADLALSVREGYDHVELAKRYTTTGMATDQGKLSNVNAVRIIAEERGLDPAKVGTTTFRPFYTPVSFGALAGPATGKAFQPVRRSPLHGWSQAQGAVFVEAGLWMRASHYPQAGESHWRTTVDREVATVRRAAGLVDMSTLGKIEVIGPDAAVFLDRVYCNRIADLPVGRVTYGLMLREDGFAYDDGLVARLSDDHFYLTTSTAMAGPALAHLEYCAQVLWPALDVTLLSSSDQWAEMALAGPMARRILAAVADGDVSDAALPVNAVAPMSFLGGRVHGRLLRVSYSGELGFELAVPAGFGEALAEAVMAAGAPYGITAYGLEALAVMRIEKGYVTHNEMNGTVTADDLGLGMLVARDKPDFVGCRMLNREGLRDQDRLQLVGLRPVEPGATFKTGAHLLRTGAEATLENDQGHVTSSTVSPTLGSALALALLKGGAKRHGERVVVWNGLAGEAVTAVVTPPAFFDPEGLRAHG